MKKAAIILVLFPLMIAGFIACNKDKTVNPGIKNPTTDTNHIPIVNDTIGIYKGGDTIINGNDTMIIRDTAIYY